MDNWINVKDRLPKYQEDVLLYRSHHKSIKIGYRYSTDAKGENYTGDYSHYVTHWMPLPEPPKNKING